MPPLITVAIPTYNQVALIQRAIDSVLAQDVDGLEVVVYDDSTDQDYSAVISKYLDLPNFTYRKNEPNLGMVNNYRQGLHNARSDYFLNLDGDDYLTDPTFLRKATDLLQENRNGVVVIGGQRICDETGRELKLQQLTTAPYDIVEGRDFFARSISSAAPVIPHLGTVVRTDLARSIGYYTAQIINTDLHSVRRLFLRGDVILIDNICGVWNYGTVNASMKFSAEKHSNNIRSLVEPFDDAMRMIGDNPEQAQKLAGYLQSGIEKYHQDIYAICLRSEQPVRNMWTYLKEARKYDYFDRLQISRHVLWPSIRILRNLAIRIVLGRGAYVALANSMTAGGP